MIDWKRKLTSRKFWVAVCSLVTNLVVVFGGTQQETVQITALIMAGAGVIAYILGEGLADAASQSGDIYIAEPEEMKPPEEN